jgi:hypothetical protein
MRVPYSDFCKENVLLKVLDTSELLEKIEYIFRGYARDHQTGEWSPRIVGYARNEEGKFIVNEKGEPYPLYNALMNDVGISRVMGFMETQIDRISQASNLTDDDIRRLGLESNLWIIEQLYLNHDDWGVRKEDFMTICTIVDQTNYKILRQAFGDGTRGMITKTHNVSEIIQHEERQPGGLRLFGK